MTDAVSDIDLEGNDGRLTPRTTCCSNLDRHRNLGVRQAGEGRACSGRSDIPFTLGFSSLVVCDAGIGADRRETGARQGPRGAFILGALHPATSCGRSELRGSGGGVRMQRDEPDTLGLCALVPGDQF